MFSFLGVISLAGLSNVLKVILEILGVLMVLVILIYWFELDMLLIRKLEPTFRKLTGKMG